MGSLSDGPSYSGQVRVTHRLPCNPGVLTNTVTTGVLAAATAVSVGQIPDFATRFGSTYDEYRILGADVEMIPVSNASGVSVFWFDEKLTSTPTLAQSQDRTARAVPNSNANSKAFTVHRWRARDLLDLEFSAITAAPQPVTFKTYTDAANWGAPIVATALWVPRITLIVEFKGLH